MIVDSPGSGEPAGMQLLPRPDRMARYLREGYADPYDVWTMSRAIEVRRAFYQGRLAGKFGAAVIAGADWLAPSLLRRLTRAPRRIHPITAGLLAQLDARAGFRWLDPAEWRRLFRSLAACPGTDGSWSWGLGFRWMAKNGLYTERVPFVTHSPYVMEALLVLAGADSREADACMDMFHGSWRFLESLRRTEGRGGAVAVSYSPLEEPRLVVNASSYAAWAYGMHARHGLAARRAQAEEMAQRLCRWVAACQQPDGSWFYFADREPGNFIDVFHSCFVVRNLRRAAAYVEALRPLVEDAANRGWQLLKERAYDPRAGLVRRYLVRDFVDPYVWDLYDQAEYLGLLVDHGEIDRAVDFRRRVVARFASGGDWWCRVDWLGRRWGRNFLRWGIVPFWHHSAKLDAALAARRTAPSPATTAAPAVA